ncbi:MAG: chemotaxis protein CheW [Oligoflexales bacterium]|nr:chemotaxis protein CheW [Oligoflexales bacterium]
MNSVRQLSQSTYHFCSFDIADRQYAVDLLDLREVSQNPKITPIYHSSDAVHGYMNIRGQIHLVLDLRVILGYPAIPRNSDQCVIAFKNHIGDHFGILVDKINGVETVEGHRIEEYQQGNLQGKLPNQKPSLYWAVCKLEDKLILVLESRFFLDAV